MSTLPLVRALVLVTSLATATVAQAPTYAGVGGRYDQQIAAIQRNSTLGSNGTATVGASSSTRRLFVRFLADTGRNVTGFDIKLRTNWLPSVERAWLYTANAQNLPGAVVASGQIGINNNPRFCRASFEDSYRVAANTLYFMAFEVEPGMDVEFSTATGGAATTVTYFVTASGQARNAGLQFRVNADGYSPAINMTQPLVGQPFTVTCRSANPGQLAILWYGSSDTYPLDLGQFGAAGSFIYILPVEAVSFVIPGNRTASTTLSVIDDPSLRGRPIFFQWLIGVSSNSAGFVMSNYARATIQ